MLVRSRRGLGTPRLTAGSTEPRGRSAVGQQLAQVPHHEGRPGAPRARPRTPSRSMASTKPKPPRTPASTPASASSTMAVRSGATAQPARRLQEDRGVGLAGEAQGHAVDAVHLDLERPRTPAADSTSVAFRLAEMIATCRPAATSRRTNSTVVGNGCDAAGRHLGQEHAVLAVAQPPHGLAGPADRRGCPREAACRVKPGSHGRRRSAACHRRTAGSPPSSNGRRDRFAVGRACGEHGVEQLLPGPEVHRRGLRDHTVHIEDDSVDARQGERGRDRRTRPRPCGCHGAGSGRSVGRGEAVRGRQHVAAGDERRDTRWRSTGRPRRRTCSAPRAGPGRPPARRTVAGRRAHRSAVRRSTSRSPSVARHGSTQQRPDDRAHDRGRHQPPAGERGQRPADRPRCSGCPWRGWSRRRRGTPATAPRPPARGRRTDAMRRSRPDRDRLVPDDERGDPIDARPWAAPAAAPGPGETGRSRSHPGAPRARCPRPGWGPPSRHELPKKSVAAARIEPPRRGAGGRRDARRRPSPLDPSGGDPFHEIALEEEVQDQDRHGRHDDDGHERRPVGQEPARRSECGQTERDACNGPGP